MSDQFPYGIWNSESDYLIAIHRDDTYKICLQDVCNSGVIVWENPRMDGGNDYGPYLLDFDQKPIAMKLMNESLFFSLHDDEADYGKIKHPSFYQHQLETSRVYCKSRPCKNFGGLDRPWFSFYLTDE